MGLSLDEQRRQYLTLTLTFFHIFSLCSSTLAIPNTRFLQLYSFNEDPLRPAIPVLVLATPKHYNEPTLIDLTARLDDEKVPRRHTRHINDQTMRRFERRGMNNVGEKMYQIQGVGDLPMFRFGRR